MITFLIGFVVLILGALLYGRLSERVMKPTDDPTPAITKQDGVDFVPMSKTKNSLIELLNIAGTGPILGPIQGALFGPIAFITIPIGCVIGGAFHDYMSGMISVRNDGHQMPGLIRKYLGKCMHAFYLFSVGLLLLLLGVVFVYTPGDLFVMQILKQDSGVSNPIIWVVYGGIFAYYILATLFPVDKIIGKVYPIFGAVLLLSAVGVFAGIFIKGYSLPEIWDGALSAFPNSGNFMPIFFVTVTCGICSGFHSTQATIISRTVKNEHEGRAVFYDMMIIEGGIAMIWAAATMGAMRMGLTTPDMVSGNPVEVVGIVARDMLGKVGGVIAIIGVIVLPITSGDTALRSLRMIVGDTLHIDQTKKRKVLPMAMIIFIVVAGILFWAKLNPEGFQILWRYSSWANEATIAIVFAMIVMYMKRHGMPYIMALLPGVFYMYVISSYILNARIGFHVPWTGAYIIAGVLTLVYAVALMLVKSKASGQET